MAKILLLDGNSLVYRAFFALPTDMATASGQVTNAVFGFTSMLINLLKDHQPDGIGIAFDRPEPTFRHELVADYKANRAPMPSDLAEQIPLVHEGGIAKLIAGAQSHAIIPVIASVGQVGCWIPLSGPMCCMRRPPSPWYQPIR